MINASADKQDHTLGRDNGHYLNYSVYISEGSFK